MQGIGASIKNIPHTIFKVLLDMGSTASILSNRVAKYGKKLLRTDTKCQWSNSNGRFATSEKVKLIFSLPEFSESKKIIHDFHVIPSMKLDYDMIIGLDLLNKLGIVLDFDRKILEWNKTEVEMKVRTKITT
jgi:hypothetical protein